MKSDRLKKSQLGVRMKEYEEVAENLRLLDPQKPWIARLDGHCFHTFASCFEKPFDKILNRIMVEVTKDLVIEYKASTGYTQSDEITLIFPERKDKSGNVRGIMFAGRIMKISTVMAGYCSSRFTYHCFKQSETYPKDYEKYDSVMKKLTEGSGHFDCRVFNVSKDPELLNNIIWRIRDSVRNSKLNLGRKYYSQRQLHGLKQDEVVEKLAKEKKVLWKEQPIGMRYGTFVKKELYEMEGKNFKTGDAVTFTRTRTVVVLLELNEFSEKYLDFLVQKYNPIEKQNEKGMEK